MRSMLGMALVALSCAPEQPMPYQAPSTKRMADRLAEIAQNLNPAINTYINAERVEYLKTLPQPYIATLNDSNTSSCGIVLFSSSASICVHLRIT